MLDTLDKIGAVMEHIKHVQDNCNKVGVKLIELGETNLGRELIKNGQIHDNSKWEGIEWEHLFGDDPLLRVAIKHHQSINPHHPEFWGGGIHDMPDIYLAEMVCDWAARSQEFGTSLRDWVSEKSTAKYGYTMEDKVGVSIMKFLNLLCSKPFA